MEQTNQRSQLVALWVGSDSHAQKLNLSRFRITTLLVVALIVAGFHHSDVTRRDLSLRLFQVEPKRNWYLAAIGLWVT